MAMNKKAMFFTLIAIVMVVTIMAFFLPDAGYISQSSKIPTVRIRVAKANNLIRNFKTDLVENELKSSGYYGVKQVLKCMQYKEQFLADYEGDFYEIMVNGTLNDNNLTYECGSDYMINKSLNYRLNLLSEMPEEQLHIFTNFTIMDVSMYQSNETSFYKLGLMLDYNIKMDAGIARWDTNTTLTTMIDLDEFNDPYYIGNANMTNNIDFVNTTDWTVPLVNDQIDNIRYTYSEYAPSFIMRLENNSNKSSCCGMESFINPYAMNMTTDEPWAYVDYCFYGRECQGSIPGNKSLWNITGISSVSISEKYYMFKLDSYHLAKYNLTDDVETRVVCEGASC